MTQDAVWALTLSEAAGRATQTCRDTTSGGRPLHVVIGLDFGTATTKVVVRTPYENGNRAYAVAWNPAPTAPAQGYLLSSRVYINTDGHASLTFEEGATAYGDLKEPYLDPSISGECDSDAWRTTAFIALVIRHTRAWFFRSKTLFQERPITWSMNVGMPATDGKAKLLRPRLKAMAECAWRVANEESVVDQVTVRRMASADCSTPSQDPGQACYIRVFSELVAAVTAFVRSKMGGTGLYVLVDVGAGTVDVCSFRYHRDAQQEHAYPMLDAEVERNGTDALRRLRAEQLAQVGLTQPRFSREDNVLLGAELAAGFGAADAPAALQAVLKADAELSKRASTQFAKVCAATKKHRDPHDRSWADGLRVLMCGGGRGIPAYGQGIQAASDRACESYGVAAFRMVDDDLRAAHGFLEPFTTNTWSRISVASGLSYPDMDFGYEVDSDDIENVACEPRRAELREILEK